VERVNAAPSFDLYPTLVQVPGGGQQVVIENFARNINVGTKEEEGEQTWEFFLGRVTRTAGLQVRYLSLHGIETCHDTSKYDFDEFPIISFSGQTVPQTSPAVLIFLFNH
jgi:hypothetical protein